MIVKIVWVCHGAATVKNVKSAASEVLTEEEIDFIDSNIKVDIDFVRYYTLSDDTIQKIVSDYCIKHNIKLKRIITHSLECKVKIAGTKDDSYNLFLYLLTTYHDALKNFSY